MKRAILLVVLVSISAIAQTRPDSLESYVRFLSSDKLEGRLTGTPQAAEAAQWIAGKFKEYGLKPLFPNYFQKYDFNLKAILGKNNSMAFVIGGTSLTARLDSDYVPYVFSDSGLAKGSIAFAGYGISARDSNYDDYSGIDVKGRIVVVMKGTPREDSTSDRLYKFSAVRMKLMTARDLGAAGIIVVNRKSDKSLARFEYEYSSSAGIVAINMAYDFANRILKKGGVDLDGAILKIEQTMRPSSAELRGTEANLSVDISVVRTKAINVAGILWPENISDSTYYIIGAHYDHLGWGPFGSMKPDTVAIHHGADDNASGVAGVLELARFYGSHPEAVRRPILFVSFSGEEEGLLGSQYFVEHMPVAKEKVGAMLNMDMVGRLRNDRLIVGGMGSATQWESFVRSIDKKLGMDSLSLSLDMEGFGPSDHASFYSKAIPVLFFFTDVHSDYHKPSDTYEKLNYTGEEKVLGFVRDALDSLVDARWIPSFTKVVAAQRPTEGVRAYLGTIPDFGNQESGYKLSGVTPGSPADKAGLRGGDVITRIGSKEIKNIYDLTYVLQALRPGDKVVIRYVRDGNKETTEAVVGRR